MKKIIISIFVVLIAVSAIWLYTTRSGGNSTAPQSESSISRFIEIPEIDNFKQLKSALTRSPTAGNEQKIWVEFTLITPQYFKLKALSESIEKEKIDSKIKEYEEQYRYPGSLAFLVKINTHTMDTGEFIIENLCILRDDSGNEYKPTGWLELPSPMPAMASHHRAGILFFPSSNPDGTPVISTETKYIEVIMKNVGLVEERNFRWKLPLSQPEGS
ncbi:MAG: hypothetical protein ACE5QV_03415 [Fidelibacterota bacterium]